MGICEGIKNRNTLRKANLILTIIPIYIYNKSE